MILRFVFCTLLMAGMAHAAPNYTNSAPAIGSQYGLVQNVQNYSSNPFWDPNGPYNQRVAPTVVYLQGTDLNTEECQRTVATLIAAYCSAVNNCIDLVLSDVRPNIMLQLSRLPGHNYASACSGFIDSEFSSYKSKYANAGPTNRPTPFPTGTVPTTDPDAYQFKIPNPYEIKDEDWRIEKKQRERELQYLQSQNGAGSERLARADFPLTAADLSFEERMQNKAAGYAPFKDASPYAKGNLGSNSNWETEEDYLKRLEDQGKLVKPQKNGNGNGTTPNRDDKIHVKITLKAK